MRHALLALLLAAPAAAIPDCRPDSALAKWMFTNDEPLVRTPSGMPGRVKQDWDGGNNLPDVPMSYDFYVTDEQTAEWLARGENAQACAAVDWAWETGDPLLLIGRMFDGSSCLAQRGGQITTTSGGSRYARFGLLRYCRVVPPPAPPSPVDP